MSWLRGLGVETFRRQNPDWEVTLYQRPPGQMHPVHASDLWRYEILADEGGVYFDTDIIFFRPFPDELLQHDVVLSCHPRHRFSNIGCLLASPDNPFFREIAQYAKRRYVEMVDTKFWDGQLIGSPIFNRMFQEWCKMERKEFDPEELMAFLSDRYQIRFGLLPYRFVTPIDSFGLHRLYNNIPFRPPAETIGVHWYAGDRFNSKPFEKRIDADNWRNHNCYLTQALNVALRDQPCPSS